MKRIALFSLVMAALLSACSPPSVRHRVDVRVQADGSCLLEDQPVACRDAGAQAAHRYTAQGVSVVLLMDHQAPPDSGLAVRTGLQTAHISHVQFGDPAHQVPLRKETGLD
jgi:biopolymer transport protein ExbD